MSSQDQKNNSSMDIDSTENSSSINAGEGSAPVSGAIPTNSASGSASASSTSSSQTGAQVVIGAASDGLNAMETDSPQQGQQSRDSTNASSSSSSKPSKKFYGAFSKYAASQATTSSTPVTSHFSKVNIVPTASFDLMSYISGYEGIAAIERLIYIGDRCSQLQLEAYQAALDRLKHTDNTQLYRLLVERLSGVVGLKFDLNWVDMKNAQAQQKFEQLEMELSSFKANLIKENVRIASRDLGDFHFNRGDYGAALRAYSRMRDYCSTPAHHTDMNIHQSRACLQLNSFAQLLTHIARAEQTPDLNKGVASTLKVWAALAHLHERKYKIAARKLLELRIADIPSNINQTVTVDDITTYTTMMALAEFDRRDLGNRILRNPEFKPFLESCPVMLELVTSFYDSKYGTCMDILNRISPDLKLDMRLGEHVDTLVKHIKAKALIQYFTPYSSVDLVEMSKAFNTTVAALEKELADLIVTGSISARIDSHNKRLFATQNDQRSSTFDKAYNAGDAFRSDSMAMLLRINLIRNNFLVKGGKGSGAHHPGLPGHPGQMHPEFAGEHMRSKGR